MSVAKCDDDLSVVGTIKMSLLQAHLTDRAPSNWIPRPSIGAQQDENITESRCLAAWSLGHRDAHIITLMQDGTVIIQWLMEMQPIEQH